jgi:Fibronectin type III-like domain
VETRTFAPGATAYLARDIDYAFQQTLTIHLFMQMTVRSQFIVATATITNPGKRRVTEIVQCYINIRGVSTEQPVRNLKGFTRITLDPCQTQTVQFPLGFNELSFYNAKVQQVVEPADYRLHRRQLHRHQCCPLRDHAVAPGESSPNGE